VLFPLSGIDAFIPEPAAARAIDVPEAVATPGPRKDAPEAVMTIEPEGVGGLEGDYVATLFTPDRLRRDW
jgi:hypothetical protein